ncbi:MAG TPA: hypothetical protein VHT70_02750 [Candidatus Saccharimonadales bacterium]|jgi:hypothetical protein|nr:hypothetical protein [Candidatus Saccharimonadales bacterium]
MRYYGNPLVAGVYGSGAYGCDSYNTNNTSACTTSGGGSTGSGSAGGVLTNTGIIVIAVVSLACAIICVSMFVRFWHRGRKARQMASEMEPTSLDDASDEHR